MLLHGLCSINCVVTQTITLFGTTQYALFAVANTDELLAHQQQGDGQLAGVNVNPVEDGVRAMEGNHAAEGSRKRKAAEKGSDRPQPKRTKRDECSRPQHRCVCGTLACMGK